MGVTLSKRVPRVYGAQLERAAGLSGADSGVIADPRQEVDDRHMYVLPVPGVHTSEQSCDTVTTVYHMWHVRLLLS